MGRRTSASFLVTRFTESPDGVRLRVQRLEGAHKPTLTNDVRVLDLDHVAVQMCRGNVFFVLDRGAVTGKAALYRLEVHPDGALGWTVRTSAQAKNVDTLPALPGFPVIGVVKTAFARAALARGWLRGRAGVG